MASASYPCLQDWPAVPWDQVSGAVQLAEASAAEAAQVPANCVLTLEQAAQQMLTQPCGLHICPDTATAQATFAAV